MGRRSHSVCSGELSLGRVCDKQNFCCCYQLEEAHRKHDLLLEMVHKDREHKRRLVSCRKGYSLTYSLTHSLIHGSASSSPQKDFKDRIQQQRSSQNQLREQRQQLVRAKRYHQDFHLQHRARLLRARTKEERVGGNRAEGEEGCCHNLRQT